MSKSKKKQTQAEEAPAPEEIPQAPAPADAVMIGSPAWREARAAEADEPPAPTFEAWDSEEILSLQIPWNEKAETREIGVPLSKEELQDAANKLADTIVEVHELEARKKASADHFKGLIVDQEEAQNRLSSLIRKGVQAKPVPCRWLYEVRGRDDAGAFIRDVNYKTLIRLDKGEAVETKPITAEERQMALPLGEDTAAPLQPDQQAVSDAYHCGYAARGAGTQEGENPHPRASRERDAWLDGWRDAEADTEDGSFSGAYDNGRTGYASPGIMPEHNPYPEGSPAAAAWRKGWDDALNEGPEAIDAEADEAA